MPHRRLWQQMVRAREDLKDERTRQPATSVWMHFTGLPEDHSRIDCNANVDCWSECSTTDTTAQKWPVSTARPAPMLSQAEMALVEKMMDALQIGSSQHKVVKGPPEMQRSIPLRAAISKQTLEISALIESCKPKSLPWTAHGPVTDDSPTKITTRTTRTRRLYR
ncbi:unnamed protein product [Polarella glacialis]|uniref:Uncharacterized protein n=1 Tax=Polarella glacialis TaxID=89957 RepID=A0A813G8Z3_POLGL|nr:unnamed protein product [Polarella glacialis]